MKNKINYRVILFILFVLVFLLLWLVNNKNENNIIEDFSESATAIIIEPRRHKALGFVLENFSRNLTDNWSIIVMHGNKNEDYVKDIIKNDLDLSNDRITTVNLGVDNLTINEYNKLLKDTHFYEKIPTELFLIFQTDSVICDEYSSLINQFTQYDYVGAPWEDAVGNGGLSLRRKSKMLEIIEKCPKDNGNEDIYFANPCIDIHKPTIEEAKLFSVEKLQSNISFGVHKAWAYLNDEQLDEKMKQCKPLRKLIDLNQ
jgi:hypothetical protein